MTTNSIPILYSSGPFVEHTDGSYGVVHSVFKNSCNIELVGRSLLLPILDKRLPLQPHALSAILPHNTNFLNWFSCGDEVTVTGGHITIGNNVLNWPNMRAPLDMYTIKTLKKVPMPSLMEWSIDALKWLNDYERTRPIGEINCLHPLILTMLDECMESLVEKTSIKKHWLKIIGLGAGLTPSGDDFICGLAAASYSYSPNIFNVLKRTILPEIYRTTRVSQDYLSLAFQGIYSPSIATLMNALNNHKKEDINRAVCDLLKHGSSSGMDTLVGIVGGIVTISMYKTEQTMVDFPRSG